MGTINTGSMIFLCPDIVLLYLWEDGTKIRIIYIHKFRIKLILMLLAATQVTTAQLRTTKLKSTAK